MRTTFRYKKERLVHGVVQRPRIPLTLFNGDNKIEVVALVDSGSDFAILPSGLAEFLELESGKGYRVCGIGGEVEMSRAKLNIRMGQDIIRNVDVLVPSQGCWDDMLLGRMPFFSFYDVTFRENLKRVELVRSRRQ